MAHTWKQQLLEATQLGCWCYRCLLHNHGLQGSSGELHQGGSGELPGQFTIRAGQNFATYELYFAYGPGTYVIGAFGVTVAYIVFTDFKGALVSFLASSPSELAETMQPTSRTLTVGPGGVRG